jgi:hypothetical protein
MTHLTTSLGRGRVEPAFTYETGSLEDPAISG